MVIVFSHTLRKRPIALTSHEVERISCSVGRDVADELQAICEERYRAKTLGQLMRELTALLSKGRQHIGSGDCWCCPSVEYKDPTTGIAVWIHKEVQ